MDKLQKAMEKARENRAATLGNSVGIKGSGRATELPLVPTTKKLTPLDDFTRTLNDNRIIALDDHNPQADIFRMLRTKILQLMNQNNMRTIAITSPNYGDGKTTIALNLALSLALDVKQTVLLVDLDFRKPSLHKFIGIENPKGLSEHIMGNAPLSEFLVRPPVERVSILPAGSPATNSSEILGSPKMASLARELKARYNDRIVIYDMPPVLVQDDQIAFLPHVDGVLLVINDSITKTREVTKCLQTLVTANIIGTVLNTKIKT